MLTTLAKAPSMKKMTIVHACVSIWCLLRALQCLVVMTCTSTQRLARTLRLREKVTRGLAQGIEEMTGGREES